jgi:prepilin peptidase CpaA
MISADRYALIAILLLFTVGAAVFDWRAKRLPNWLTVSMAVTGLLFHLTVGAVLGGWSGAGLGLLHALGGFAIGFGLLFILWVIGAGGGGDVKYTAALGTWLGPGPTFYVIVVAVCLVAVMSAVVMLWEVTRLGFRRSKARYIEQKKVRKEAQSEQARQDAMVRRRLMPWAVPAALATWLVLGWQILMALKSQGG